MKIKKMMPGFAALLMAFVMTSCNQVPQAAMETAQAALHGAKAVEADRYLSAEHTALSDSLTAFPAAIEAQKTEPISKRDYKPPSEKLAWITNAAETLKTGAETRKAEVRSQVETLLAELNNTIAKEKRIAWKNPDQQKKQSCP